MGADDSSTDKRLEQLEKRLTRIEHQFDLDSTSHSANSGAKHAGIAYATPGIVPSGTHVTRQGRQFAADPHADRARGAAR